MIGGEFPSDPESADSGVSESQLGTIQHIDPDAVLRGVRAVRWGRPVSLSRELVGQPGNHGRPFALESWIETKGRLTSTEDIVTIEAHGYEITHIDGLNHIGLDKSWFGGGSVDSPGPDAVSLWGRTGIVTRAIYANLPLYRGTAWIPENEPLSAVEIESLLQSSDLSVLRGDALLLDLGRDNWESESGHNAKLFPAIRPDVADWIADNEISVLAWDFLDSPASTPWEAAVHRLIWQIGLAIVDNCAFGDARQEVGGDAVACGLFLLAPLRLRGSSGCAVNPIFVL